MEVVWSGLATTIEVPLIIVFLGRLSYHEFWAHFFMKLWVV